MHCCQAIKPYDTHRAVGLVQKVGQLSSLTMASRLMGLVREVLFAALLGAGFHADAFKMAFRIPNLLRDLFAEGALSNALIPSFAMAKERGEGELIRLAAHVLGLLLLFVGFIVLGMLIFAPALVDFIAPGFSAISGKSELTTRLTRLMAPYLLCVSLASCFMGIHHTYQRFTWPALAPILFNACTIVGGAISWAMGLSIDRIVVLWSVAVLIGGIAQALVQWWPLWTKKHISWPKLRGAFGHPRVRHVFMLMGPIVIALAGTQVNILINAQLASKLPEGAPSWLDYAFRLVQLPIGVFGVAIGTITLANTSNYIAQKNFTAYFSSVFEAIVLGLALTLPSAIGLWILSEDIVAMIFQRGVFGLRDTVETAGALSFYALGLPAYALVKIVAPVFFPMGKPKLPMMASLCGVAMNITFSLLMYQTMGHRGLALGTALGVSINILILLVACYAMQRKWNYGNLAVYGVDLIKIIGLSVIFFLGLQWAKNIISQGTPMNALALMGLIGFSAFLYGLLAMFFGVKAVKPLEKKIRARLGRA